MPGTLSVADGATSTLFCDTGEEAVGKGGGYVAPFGKLGKRADWWNQDEGLVEELWVESEGMIKGAGFLRLSDEEMMLGSMIVQEPCIVSGIARLFKVPRCCTITLNRPNTTYDIH